MPEFWNPRYDANRNISALCPTAAAIHEKRQGAATQGRVAGRAPQVWRRVLVPASTRLPKLHLVLLRVMGSGGGHVHEFEFAGGRYGMPDPDWPDESMDDKVKVTLTKVLGYSTTFTCTYDFGDDWAHKIKVERVDAMAADLKLLFPMCLAGAGACPPEDVGGASGYADFLEAIADLAHPEHGDTTAWIGRPFDPMPSLCRKPRIDCMRSSSS